ncbi:serine/threonine-protein kinase 17A-like [Anopheles nili]|uniref:serine/threonine-protein kinase 17A-like n=1 Tax=Anopheles nili TaxID=185578 RepID=UPI00237B2009|nr:serine/threonine-protein kinase 17A-like [Anopheles nili]
MHLPEGFYHVGDGRVGLSDDHLGRVKTSRAIADVYEIEESWIAKGMYGIVRSAISKQSGQCYAAKFLRRRRRGQCCLNEINHEIAVLLLCADSDHVVKLQAVHETRSDIALILELATGGELQALIDEQGQLSEQKTRVCMREILRALQHMHNKSIAHLDLKPQNILLAGKDVEDGLKLCDFGIARFIGENNKIYEIIGTPDYVAPEVLHYDPLSLQTDIWSIGVVAYVLLTGMSPFGGDSRQETFLNVTKCSLTFPDDLFTGISSDAIDFIKSTLRIKPKERLTVEECLEHRWLKEETICVQEEDLAARVIAACTSTDFDKWQEADGDEMPTPESRSSCAVSPVLIHSNQSNGESRYSCPVVATVDEEDLCKASERLTAQTTDGHDTKSVLGSPRLVSDSADDNKENVLVVGVVTRSLFPDAPTTPKVSRKTLPTEPLNDGHHHHLHHIHHHHVLHHHHHQHSSNQTTTVSSSILHQQPPSNFAQSGSGSNTVTSTSNTNDSTTTTLHVSLVCPGSSSGKKNFVQLFQSQQQQKSGAEILMAPAIATPSSNGNGEGDSNCATSSLVLISTSSAAPHVSETNDTIENGVSTATISASSAATITEMPTSSSTSSSCRTTTLCGLKCTESSIPGVVSRRMSSPGHKSLQQCDKDAIIC